MEIYDDNETNRNTLEAIVMKTTISKTLTLQEAAVYLNLSPSTVIEHYETGSLPGQNINDIWQFVQDELEIWSNRCDQHKVLLRQVGALAHDENFEEFQAELDRQRKLNTFESID